MLGGEAFGAQALGSTGEEEAPANVFFQATDIDDLCLEPAVAGQSIDGTCP